ncbi:hypothetical protein HK105_208351 [Polyrhizophydium stewartii]|uniref:DUF6729 domain-containing protein n=1 Tax=Polyrhizophydium stewartii TaxID=2732419 RepID=A0ABR4MXZ6_9FUNG
MVARPRRNPTAQRGRAPARADGAADPPAEQPPDGPPAPDEAAAATDPGATAAAVKRKPPLERSASPKRQRTDGAAPDGAAKAAVDTAPASAEHQGSAATDAPILAGAGAGAVADEPPIEPQIGGDLSLEDTGIGVGLELALGLDSLGSDEDDDDDDDDDEEEEEEEDIGIGFGLPGAEADARLDDGEIDGHVPAGKRARLSADAPASAGPHAEPADRPGRRRGILASSGRDDDDDEDEDDDDDEGSFDEDDDDERGGDAANTESMRQALIAGWLERTHRTYHFNDNFDWPTLEAFLIKLRSMEAGVMELLRKGQIFFTLIPQAASSGAASGAASGAVHDKAAQGDLAGAAADGHPLHGESGADDEARAANGDSDAGGRDEDEDLAGSDAGSSRRPPAGAARQKAPIKVAVWAPHVIFPDTKFKCPECKGLIARESAQPDRLRRVTALANCYLLVTYRYRCSACKTQFQSTTEAFFDNLPANVRQTLPVTIFSRSCIDNELIDIVDEYGKTRKDRSNVNAMLNRKHRNCILHHPALRVTSITRRVSRKHGSGQPGADASARGHNMSDGEGDSEHAGDSGSRTPRHASGAGSRFGPGKSSGTRNRTLLPAPPAPSDTLTVVPLSMLLPGSDPSQSVPLYIPATAMHMLPQYLAMLHVQINQLARRQIPGPRPAGQQQSIPPAPQALDPAQASGADADGRAAAANGATAQSAVPAALGSIDEIRDAVAHAIEPFASGVQAVDARISATLASPETVVKRKRGRPRKNSIQPAASSVVSPAQATLQHAAVGINSVPLMHAPVGQPALPLAATARMPDTSAFGTPASAAPVKIDPFAARLALTPSARLAAPAGQDLAASEDGGVTPGGRKLLPLLPRVKDGESIINVSPVTTNFSSRQQRKPSRCAVCLMSGCPGRYRRIKCTFYRLMDNPQFLAAKHYISTYDEMLELAKIFNGAGALPPPPQPRQRQLLPALPSMDSADLASQSVVAARAAAAYASALERAAEASSKASRRSLGKQEDLPSATAQAVLPSGLDVVAANPSTPSGGDNRAAAAIAGLVDTPNISDLVAFFSMPEIKERLLALLPIKTAPGEGSPAAGESHAARAAKRKAADEDGDEGGGTADGDRQRPGAAYRNVKELAAAVAAAAVADTHERSSRKAAAASEEPEPAASPRHSPAAEPPPEPAEAAADAAAMTDDDDLGLDSESELEG